MAVFRLFAMLIYSLLNSAKLTCSCDCEVTLLTVEVLLIGWWCWCCLGCSGICCLSIVVLILIDLLCSAGDACCSGIPFGKEPVSARSKSNKFPLRPKMSRSNRIKSSWRTTSRISVKNEAWEKNKINWLLSMHSFFFNLLKLVDWTNLHTSFAYLI